VRSARPAHPLRLTRHPCTPSAPHAPRSPALCRAPTLRLRSASHRELTQKIKGLETQLEETQSEAATARQDFTVSETQRKQLQTELDAARVELSQLGKALAKAQAIADQCDGRIQQETAKLSEELAEIKSRPIPPNPAEVRQQVLSAFDVATASLVEEMAESTSGGGVGEEVFTVGVNGFDSVAMEAEGLSLEVKAEQYLRAAMGRAVRAVEPARLEAVDKWRGELKRRRALQDTLQEIKGSIRVMCRVRPTAAGEGETVVALPTPTDVVLTQPGRDGRRSFTFDHAFAPNCSQAAVFEEVSLSKRSP